jgi:hypothetical protein
MSIALLSPPPRRLSAEAAEAEAVSIGRNKFIALKSPCIKVA